MQECPQWFEKLTKNLVIQSGDYERYKILEVNDNDVKSSLNVLVNS